MKVLVTGAKGFVGRNLCESLKIIRDGKDRRERYRSLLPLTVYEYDIDGTREELSLYCAEADFVFNLAGVNRPENPEDFMKGNFGFASELLGLLEHHGNKCPVMLSSSAQAVRRRLSRGATPVPFTASPSWRGRTCFASILRAPVRRSTSIGSPTCTASGVGQTTTPPLRRFAMRLLTVAGFM